MTAPTSENIFDPDFVRELFDEMSATYGTVNLISSFGFCLRWRRQCVTAVDVPPAARVVDLMSGMGEACHALARYLDDTASAVAVDYSAAMCARARRYENGSLGFPVEVRQSDALRTGLPDDSADLVVSTFGLKTLEPAAMSRFAAEIHRVLRPGGRFSLLEISVPPAAILRAPYLFYLRHVIPILGRLFLGNPDNYRHLAVYTEAFGNCDDFRRHAQAAGLHADPASYFFGCATGVIGHKPAA